MPWIETCVMQARVKFVMNLLEGTYSMSELCRAYHISRKTGYKWLSRYRQGGLSDLSDRRRVPMHHPHAMASELKDTILAIKSRFPRMGRP